MAQPRNSAADAIHVHCAFREEADGDDVAAAQVADKWCLLWAWECRFEWWLLQAAHEDTGRHMMVIVVVTSCALIWLQ